MPSLLARFTAEENYVLAVDAKEKSNARVLLVCSASRDSQIPATSRGYALEGSAGLLSGLSALDPCRGGSSVASGSLKRNVGVRDCMN
jgi:hypothetical protein